MEVGGSRDWVVCSEDYHTHPATFPYLHAFVIHKLGGTLDVNDVKEGYRSTELPKGRGQNKILWHQKGMKKRGGVAHLICSMALWAERHAPETTTIEVYSNTRSIRPFGRLAPILIGKEPVNSIAMLNTGEMRCPD